LLLATLALADPPPGGTPPPVQCGGRPPLTSGSLSDGQYVALEPIKDFRGAEPGEKGSRWFHEVVLTIAGGKVSAFEAPVVYRHGTRYDSASDGGFYRFEGCLAIDGDHYRSDMRLMSCDYCRESEELTPTKTLSIAAQGRDIVVDGKRYRRLANPRGNSRR
jgi:hypothetical protein